MGRSNGSIELENMEQEEIEMFYKFLQGTDCPENLHTQNQPHLTAEEAFSVIYYLQEIMEILPDKYEMCKECGCIYDAECEGACIGEDTTIIGENGEEIPGNFLAEQYGTYCDSCRLD